MTRDDRNRSPSDLHDLQQLQSANLDHGTVDRRHLRSGDDGKGETVHSCVRCYRSDNEKCRGYCSHGISLSFSTGERALPGRAGVLCLGTQETDEQPYI